MDIRTILCAETDDALEIGTVEDDNNNIFVLTPTVVNPIVLVTFFTGNALLIALISKRILFLDCCTNVR